MTIILTSPTRSPSRPPATRAVTEGQRVRRDRPRLHRQGQVQVRPRIVGRAGPMTVENICAISAPNPIAARIAQARPVVGLRSGDVSTASLMSLTSGCVGTTVRARRWPADPGDDLPPASPPESGGGCTVPPRAFSHQDARVRHALGCHRGVEDARPRAAGRSAGAVDDLGPHDQVLGRRLAPVHGAAGGIEWGRLQRQPSFESFVGGPVSRDNAVSARPRVRPTVPVATVVFVVYVVIFIGLMKASGFAYHGHLQHDRGRGARRRAAARRRVAVADRLRRVPPAGTSCSRDPRRL